VSTRKGSKRNAPKTLPFGFPKKGSVPRGFNGNTEPQDNARGIMGTALAMPVALAVLLLGLGFGFWKFRCELPKQSGRKRKQKRKCLSRRRVFALPASCRIGSGTPKGQRAAVAFLCLLSLAKERK
jgi:hypothetical protein